MEEWEIMYVSDMECAERTKKMIRSNERGMRYLGVLALIEEFKGRENVLLKYFSDPFDGIIRYWRAGERGPLDSSTAYGADRASIYFTEDHAITVGNSGLFLGYPRDVDRLI